MALITCQECGNDVSTDAKTCPKCGVKVCVPVGKIGKLLSFVVGLGVIIAAIQDYERKTTEVAKTPAQKAAEEQARNADAQRVSTASAALKSIQNVLRNPATVQWGDVLVNKDASIVCIDYRAQNGFGGFNHEAVLFINGKPKRDLALWNKHCAEKPLFDVKAAAVRWLH